MKTCEQVMTKNPVCCVSNQTVEKAAQFMKTEDVGSIPVVDDPQSKKLVGIVTDRDLALKVVAEGRSPASTRISDVMTRHPVTCHEDDDLSKAMDTMRQHQVRRIPVIDKNDHLVGIIAQADVAMQSDNPQKTAEVVEDISKPVQAAAH